MPRASRYLREGYTYHLTHRCHDRRFLSIDMDRLLQSLDLPDAASLERLHRDGISTQIEREDLSRQSHWTEAVAIGSRAFVAQADKENTYRKRFTQYSVREEGQPSVWVIKEAHRPLIVSSLSK